MTCLLDVNLLMALLWENHEHHALARQHQLSLATLDEPLARSFAGEAGLVTLVR